MTGRAYHLLMCLALPLVLATTGCAFGTRHTVLSYPPAAAVPAAGVGVAEAAPAPTHLPIIVIPFKDLRADKGSIGAVRNGLGMRTASVVADNDVADWVTESVKLELKKAGYQVSESGAPTDSAGPPVLSGDVLKVFGDAYLTYNGDVSFMARVSRGGKEVLAKTYTVHKGGGINGTASGGAYGRLLSVALSEAIAQLLVDLGQLPRAP